MLSDLVDEVPGLLSVVVVSADGLPMLSSDDEADSAPQAVSRDNGTDLATIVSGLASLTSGASELMEAGVVKQTMVSMDHGSLCVMSISDGSLLGAYAAPECDMSAVAYHMALFVGRAGHLLTPELRTELRRSMESGAELPPLPRKRKHKRTEQEPRP
ncbi:roadblock/LC7 domain-containing protein [Streptomyces sp. Z26]|uniref:roadblock/LC7 domain-containing protein n=2 Tax=Streptomyces TaxID=1883 RepID=UPI001F0BB51E|nr:roadblock/LC7 domain-containing protein [Streptomyces sp. Z26]